MGTVGSNDQVQTVGRLFPLKTATPPQELVTLLTAATKASLEFYDLTPLGDPRIGVRVTDSWVRECWTDSGNDPARLTDNTLVMLFACIAKGSVN